MPFTPLGSDTKLNTPSIPSFANVASGISINSQGNAVGGLTQPPATQQASLLTSSLGTPSTGTTITPSGGINFSAAKTNLPPASGTAIGSTASNIYQTPNGGSYNAATGSFTPATGFSIDTSNIPSNALSSSNNYGTLSQSHSQYQDAVNGLVQANQYSPDYINAYKANQNAALLNPSTNANFYNGVGTQGSSIGQATVQTGREQAQNTLTAANAGIDLQAQALIRSGNIAGAQALVQGTAPQSVSPGSSLVTPTNGQEVYSGLGGYQAVQNIGSVSSLANSYPDAGILPTDDITTARNKAQSSPKFLSDNFASGGQISLNPTTGKPVVLSPTQASQAKGYTDVIQQTTANRASLAGAIQTADQNFPLLLQSMKAAGINDLSAPLANQIQNNVTARINGSLASFNSIRQSLVATYAQVLSRGQAVTVDVSNEANKLVPNDISYNDMTKLYATLKQEAGNVISGIDAQNQSATQALNGLYGQGTPAPNISSVGNSWANL